MFTSLFSSKNEKLVSRWKKEHQNIIVHAHKVIATYAKGNHKETKKELVNLNDIAIDHLMNEDIELYKLLKYEKRLDDETEELIQTFKKSFMGTKIALMHFLFNYSKAEVTLDDEFFSQFTEIIDVVVERIKFEEKNLYILLSKK